MQAFLLQRLDDKELMFKSLKKEETIPTIIATSVQDAIEKAETVSWQHIVVKATKTCCSRYVVRGKVYDVLKRLARFQRRKECQGMRFCIQPDAVHYLGAVNKQEVPIEWRVYVSGSDKKAPSATGQVVIKRGNSTPSSHDSTTLIKHTNDILSRICKQFSGPSFGPRLIARFDWIRCNNGWRIMEINVFDPESTCACRGRIEGYCLIEE